jgi:leucyl aminopeptidase
MEIQLASKDLVAIEVDVLAVPVVQGDMSKQKLVHVLDQALDRALLSHAVKADFRAKNDQVFELATLGKLPAARLLLVGVGAKREFDDSRLRAYAATAARVATGANASSLALGLPENAQGAASLRSVGEGLVLGTYRFTKYLTGERVPKTDLLQTTVLKTRGRPSAAEQTAVHLGAELGRAVGIARDAVNEPPNEFTPDAMARLAAEVAKRYRLKVTILDKKGIQGAGMKLCAAVAQGSAHEPRFIHLSYTPPKPKKRLVFVGKGLTFDSGGLCIKPAAGMGEMKCDMAGGAAVIALMAAVGILRPNVEVHGLVGAVENMPDGAAYRPGDVFGSFDGKTVEIVNTDAEGRLVLADVLAYGARLEPDLMVDAATLTGACVVALGKSCSGYFTPDDRLARSFERAAREAGESTWRLPLLDELKEQLKSDIADLKHTGERWGGAISAALFLREFVGSVPWIHCDIAGPALSEKASGTVPKGGTGHAVLTFLRLVENAATRS